MAESDGLLAIGGDLSPERLLAAYRKGIFPWYAEGQPILWWSPDPRLVLYPFEFICSRSLRRTLRRRTFRVTSDQAFEEVITACARMKRKDNAGTWIVDDMLRAYIRLHHLGWAHSLEAWCNGDLVGGLYGLHIGQGFFGESMFSRMSDASKVCLAALVAYARRQSLNLIDCQVDSAHLKRLGARLIARKRFADQLAQAVSSTACAAIWPSQAQISEDIWGPMLAEVFF
jgi:leucyl/phenylalanyl-tRNA--protein transferase